MYMNLHLNHATYSMVNDPDTEQSHPGRGTGVDLADSVQGKLQRTGGDIAPPVSTVGPLMWQQESRGCRILFQSGEGRRHGGRGSSGFVCRTPFGFLP